MKVRSGLIACAVLLSLGAAGCTGPRAPLNPPQLIGDSETDMSLQLFMQATILLARYYGYSTLSYEEISDRAAKAGFSSLPFMPPIVASATPKLRSFTVDVAKTSEFRKQVQNSIGYKGLLAYYIKTGLRASQVVCRNYLLGLDEKNQYLEFLKKEFGVAYTLADGILLAVSANGTLLHAFALSRDAAEGSINAYEQYRFLSIDREAARVLVETAQSKYAAYYIDQINKSGSLHLASRSATGDLPEFFTFADALNAISTIEYQCTRSGIRSLLTRAVNNTPTNLDVDRNTGTVMFKSDQQTVGTTQSVKPGTASPEKPKVTGKVNSPEQPTSSGAHQPAAAAVAPPVVSPTPQ